MKRKKLILILAVEAVLVCVLMALSKSVQNMNFSILSFPLEPVFLGLKAAANAGPVGNGFAVLIAAVLILLPVFFALRTRGEGIVPECVALLLLAGAIGLGLYGCWNPNAFRHELVGGSQEMESALRVIFSLCILSMLILFIVLRLIRLFRNGHKEQLLHYLRGLLYVLCFLSTAGLAYTLSSGVLSVIDGLPTPADMTLMIAKTLTTAAGLILDLAVSFRMFDLLDAASSEEQEALKEAAGKVSRISCITLACTVWFTAALHILQILLISSLTDNQFNVEPPINQVFFLLMILLLSRLLAENKELRDDNSMFI